MPPKKKPRAMHYFILYHPATNSWFINKSQTPKQSARRQIHRAFHEGRADYYCDFYKDIREYGEEAFIIRYCVELPDFCEGVRAHYIKNCEPNEEIYKAVMSLREEPLSDDEARELKYERRQIRQAEKAAAKALEKNGKKN